MHPNDPELRSFIAVGAGSDFPIQNLPYGVFSTSENAAPRVGVAIGEFVLDLSKLEREGMLDLDETSVFDAGSVNKFMSLGQAAWTKTRRRISELLRHDNPELRDHAALRKNAFVLQKDARMHLPLTVSGFTDFYSSKEHATNVGIMLRGKDNALQPNWLFMPIGYNGRSSTVVVSGTQIVRPWGQIKSPSISAPSFGPSQRLDFELEMGVIIGQGSSIGRRVGEEEAEDMIFGFVLLNDLSARDLQAWEYVPLGPFQAKAFATSIGSWIVTREALEPFRVDGPSQDPAPLEYLAQRKPNNYDIELEVDLIADGSSKAARITRTNFRYMYWSSVQQLVHHTSSGCAMNVGDLLGSGTISGPEKSQRGSLLEVAWNGSEPIRLANGSERTFLLDGDRLVISGHCGKGGHRIGFGKVEGTIVGSDGKMP